jgi:hypothetical protein
MKIIISESRIVQLMKVFLKKNYPSLLEPFKIVDTWVIGARKYYDINNEIVIYEQIEVQSKLDDTKFYVNEKYESLYDMFGEEAFEEFFRQVHNIYLSDLEKFKYNWSFSKS